MKNNFLRRKAPSMIHSIVLVNLATFNITFQPYFIHFCKEIKCLGHKSTAFMYIIMSVCMYYVFFRFLFVRPLLSVLARGRDRVFFNVFYGFNVSLLSLLFVSY